MSPFTACRNIAFIFIIVMLESFKLLSAVCPTGWLAWQESCYILLPDKMTWSAASAACDELGVRIAVPDSQEEHDLLWHEMTAWMASFGARTDNDLQLWIGCTKTSGVRQAMCPGANGNPVFTNWAGTEPSNGDGEDCIRMTSTFGGKWADDYCSSTRFVACERGALLPAHCRSPVRFNRTTRAGCLRNHKIKSLLVKGAISCGLACLAEPRCHSFNIQEGTKNTENCQLNAATRFEADTNDFVDVDGCSFYEL